MILASPVPLPIGQVVKRPFIVDHQLITQPTYIVRATTRQEWVEYHRTHWGRTPHMNYKIAAYYEVSVD